MSNGKQSSEINDLFGPGKGEAVCSNHTVGTTKFRSNPSRSTHTVLTSTCGTAQAVAYQLARF